MSDIKTFAVIVALMGIGYAPVAAHQSSTGTADPDATTDLMLVPEDSLPFEMAGLVAGSHGVSGQGVWRFHAATDDVLPIPEKAAGALKPAHGTLIVDAVRDTVYWGLQGIGWIGFSNQLSISRVVDGDPVFAQGNLHGADILTREGNLPLVAVADNLSGEVYVSDTRFRSATRLGWPEGGHYSERKQFKPTDVAFTSAERMIVTDGYGKAFLYEMPIHQPGYEHFHFGGKPVSRTPHGVTFDESRNRIIVSARPEGQLKGWDPTNREWLETLALPAGSTVCDVDIWGDYALAPCLNGPGKSPGAIYILNLRKKTIASVIKPKEELGFTDAQHIHDAVWYIADNQGTCEPWIIFTYWNPGGIGAARLVSP